MPSVVPAMLTVAESLSRMSIESSSLAVSIVICGSLLVIVFSVITTVSVGSTIASSMTGTVIVAVVAPGWNRHVATERREDRYPMRRSRSRCS